MYSRSAGALLEVLLQRLADVVLDDADDRLAQLYNAGVLVCSVRTTS